MKRKKVFARIFEEDFKGRRPVIEVGRSVKKNFNFSDYKKGLYSYRQYNLNENRVKLLIDSLGKETFAKLYMKGLETF